MASPVTGGNGGGGRSSAPLPTESGSGANVHNGNGGGSFQPVGDSLSVGRINDVFAEDFTTTVIVKVSEDQIVPYSDLPFSEDNRTNIQKMLAGIAFKNPSLLTLSSLITSKMQRESIITAGQALKGMSVLKMLEHIVLNPELKAQIKIIFNYPLNGGFFNPINYILSKIRGKFFSGLSSYLKINAEETSAHLEDFVTAIGKTKNLSYFQAAVDQQKWEEFFTFVIFDEDDE